LLSDRIFLEVVRVDCLRFVGQCDARAVDPDAGQMRLLELAGMKIGLAPHQVWGLGAALGVAEVQSWPDRFQRCTAAAIGRALGGKAAHLTIADLLAFDPRNSSKP